MKLQDTNNIRILWHETPQSMNPPDRIITSQEDIDNYNRELSELVGAGYFYINVWNMSANLSLMHSTRLGYWTGEPIEQDIISENEMIEAIEAFGGAVNWSGHYPITPVMRDRLRAALTVSP